MRLLVQRFLVGALDAMAGHRSGGPVAIMSLGDASCIAVGLTFLL